MKISTNHKQVMLLVGGIMMYFALNMQRVSIPGTIFNELQSTFQASATALANLSNIYMISYALAQFPAGILADRYGGMKVVLGGGTVMTTGCLLFALAPCYGLLAFSRFLIGFGGGFVYLSLVKEVGRRYPSKFAAVTGLVLLLGFTGGFFATLPLAHLSAAVGWRTAIFTCAVVSLLAIAVMLGFWRYQVPMARSICAPTGLQVYKKVFTNLNNLKMFGSYTVNYGLFSVVLTIFGKKFLEDIGGLGNSSAAVVCGIMVLLPALSNQFMGILSTRMNNRRRPFILASCLLPLISCGFLLTGTLPFLPMILKQVLFIPAFLLFSLTGGFSSISCCLAREFNPPESTGAAIGAVNFAAYSMVAVCGVTAGLILDRFEGAARVMANGHVIYPTAAYITIFTVFFLVSAAVYKLALSLPETNGRNLYQGRKISLRVLSRFTLTFYI